MAVNARLFAGEKPQRDGRWLPVPVDALAGWSEVELPDRVRDVATMLSLDERRLLYALGREAASGKGRIVDAGCFLGGSTVALACGLVDGGGAEERIDVFDRFTVERYTVSWFHGLQPGDSFLPDFQCNIAGLEPVCRVHPGDIKAARFEEPIDVLFLDVLKTWTINDAVVPRAFGQLSTGSVVVQQDYYSGSCPWIVVTMEHLRDHFEHVADVDSSAVFICTRPIPAERLARLRHCDFVPSETVALFDRALDRRAGERHGLLLVTKAWLLMYEQSGRRGLHLLDAVARDHNSTAVRSTLEQARGSIPNRPSLLAMAAVVRLGWRLRRRVRRWRLGPP